MKTIFKQFSILHKIRKTKLGKMLVKSYLNKPRFFHVSLPFPISLRPLTHASFWIAPDKIEPETTNRIQCLGSFIKESKKKLSFFDIGSNIGWHAWNCKASTTDIPIHVFEPDAMNVFLLNETIKHSKLSGISTHSLAISDKEGEALFNLDTITSATGTLEINQKSWTEKYLKYKPEKTFVHCTCLDNLESSLTPPGIIKIDVEGHEVAVFRGASSTIEHNLPALIIESFPPKREEILTMTHDIGYLNFDAETLEEVTKKTTNILALHPDNHIFPHPLRFSDKVILS